MKILHAADFHLDSPFRALRPEQAQRRREEQRELLQALAALCRKERCELVLLAGDLFDSKEVSRQSLDALKAMAEEMAVPVCIAPGNHDFYSALSPYARESWPENVHIFKEEAPASIAFPELDCRVWGAAFRQMDCPPLTNFRASGSEVYQVMVLHGDPLSAGSFSRPVSKEAIAASNLSYLGLGHVHRSGSIKAGNTLCAWPGCLMGRGFDETGEKGALVVTLDEKISTKFCPLPGRRYETLAVEVGGNPQQAIESALPVDTKEDIYRIILRGAGQVALPELQAALQERFFDLTLKDETTAPKDLWEAETQDSLEGLYFRLLHKAMEEAEGDDKRQLRLAASLGRRLLDGEEVRLP